LVGSPADGIQFGLFGIGDKNEETLLEVGEEVTGKMVPRLARLESTTERVEKEVLAFKTNIGGDVLTKLRAVEASLQAIEATSGGATSGPTFEEVRNIFMKELIPATKDLWDFYMPRQSFAPRIRSAIGRLSVLQAGCPRASPSGWS
jgi:hypothetical protein